MKSLQINVNASLRRDLAGASRGILSCSPTCYKVAPETRVARAPSVSGGGEGTVRLTLTVDGKDVALAADTNGPESFDVVRLFVYSEGGASDVRFDDLLVSLPDSAFKTADSPASTHP